MLDKYLLTRFYRGLLASCCDLVKSSINLDVLTPQAINIDRTVGPVWDRPAPFPRYGRQHEWLRHVDTFRREIPQ